MTQTRKRCVCVCSSLYVRQVVQLRALFGFEVVCDNILYSTGCPKKVHSHKFGSNGKVLRQIFVPDILKLGSVMLF